MGGSRSTYGESTCVYGVLVGKPGGKNHWEDPGVDGRIILGWICRKLDVMAWTGSMWLGEGQVAGTCECGNEPSDSTVNLLTT